MDQIKRNLYELLFSCKGNWRNAIYIFCGPCPHPCKVDRSGCLAAIRQDGAPLLVSMQDVEKETGERIDPGDCIGTLNKEAFSSLYSRYLTWEMTKHYAHKLGVDTPLCDVTLMVMDWMNDNGHIDDDQAAMVKYYEDKMDVQVGHE